MAKIGGGCSAEQEKVEQVISRERAVWARSLFEMVRIHLSKSRQRLLPSDQRAACSHQRQTLCHRGHCRPGMSQIDDGFLPQRPQCGAITPKALIPFPEYFPVLGIWQNRSQARCGPRVAQMAGRLVLYQLQVLEA